MMEHQELQVCRERADASWGNTPSGAYHVVSPRFIAYTRIIPMRGRWFIRGREVYMFDERTELGENFFFPPGQYGGRILS